jgi:hypothetical protein
MFFNRTTTCSGICGSQCGKANQTYESPSNFGKTLPPSQKHEGYITNIDIKLNIGFKIILSAE